MVSLSIKAAGSAGVTLSLEMQGQHDAEKLLERLKTKEYNLSF